MNLFNDGMYCNLDLLNIKLLKSFNNSKRSDDMNLDVVY